MTHWTVFGCCFVTDPQLLCNILTNLLFNSAKTYQRHLVSKGYYLAHHDNKTCFLPISRYHIRLIWGIEETQKVEAICFTYEQVICLYTIFNQPFRYRIVAKSQQVLDVSQEAVHFLQGNRRVDKNPSIANTTHVIESTKIDPRAQSKKRNQQTPLDQRFKNELIKKKRQPMT